ncbi:MAG: ribonuclease III [Candidatus Latescibacteria bacterium]|nr:ribonuclease III [Candidatus Latescibacterota bacterium]
MGIGWWLKKLFNRSKLPVNVKEIESVIGYHFKNPNLLFRSLKHRSYSQEMDGTIDRSNERLEFLGDSVFNMVVSHHLYIENPEYQEGDLTKLKSALVSKTSAAIAARKIGIDRFLLISDSEEGSGGRKRTSIIADTYEAIIGAIFLDGGIEASRIFIRKSILENVPHVLNEIQKNYKSLFLELSQGKKLGHPVYKTIDESGPDHDKLFTVEVFVRGESYGTGKGKSKKAAQQMAAKEGLSNFIEQLNDDE